MDARVAIVRALHGLGDLLCAVPAMRAVRGAWPGAHVTLIGLSSAGWFVQRFPDCVDALLPFPGFPGIPEATWSAARLSHFLRETRRRPFDIALQLHGSGEASNVFTALLGAHRTAGLYGPGCLRPGVDTFFPWPCRGPESRRCLALTDALGCPPQPPHLSFPVTRADRRALAADPGLGALEPGSYVCIHAGARDPKRRWPPSRFAVVADCLAAEGFEVVLTGTASERLCAAQVAAAMRHRPVNAVGRTGLGTLAALLEGAALLVTNDTGVSHLGAAVGAPSVILFLASDPDRWAPPDRYRHRALAPRLLAGCAAGVRKARRGIPSVAEVLEESFDLLRPAVRVTLAARASS
jgi:ADP-heptose:LPS heptosyltransferase